MEGCQIKGNNVVGRNGLAVLLSSSCADPVDNLGAIGNTVGLAAVAWAESGDSSIHDDVLVNGKPQLHVDPKA